MRFIITVALLLAYQPAAGQDIIRRPTPGADSLATEISTTAPLLGPNGVPVPAHVAVQIVPPDTLLIETPFDELVYSKPLSKVALGSISGQAFLKTRGGDVKVGAGESVLVDLATPYANEFWDKTRGFGPGELEFLRSDPAGAAKSGLKWPPVAAVGFLQHRRAVEADVQGRFIMPKLAPGKYFLSCWITWEVPGRNRLESSGGWAQTIVEVVSGQESTALVH